MQPTITAFASSIKQRVKKSARQQMGTALLAGFALLLVAIAVVAALLGLGVVLATRWGTLAACLIIAVGALVLAIAAMLIVARRSKLARRQQMAARAELHRALRASGLIASELIGNKAAFLAVAIGVLAGLMARRPDPQDKP